MKKGKKAKYFKLSAAGKKSTPEKSSMNSSLKRKRPKEAGIDRNSINENDLFRIVNSSFLSPFPMALAIRGIKTALMPVTTGIAILEILTAAVYKPTSNSFEISPKVTESKVE